MGKKKVAAAVMEIPEFKGIASLFPEVAKEEKEECKEADFKVESALFSSVVTPKAGPKKRKKKGKGVPPVQPSSTSSSPDEKPQKKRKSKVDLSPGEKKQRKEKSVNASKTDAEQSEEYVPGALSAFFGGPKPSTAKVLKALQAKGHAQAKPSASQAEATFPVKQLAQEVKDAKSKSRSEKGEKIVRVEGPEEKARTVFVGNLPLEATEKDLRKLFTETGPIESMRFRSAAAPENSKIPRKAAFIKKQLHENCQRLNAYVKFKSLDSVDKALALNGSVVGGRHVVLDRANKEKAHYDKAHTIFVGNLGFNADEEEVRDHFTDCGEVKAVRIVRDRYTQLGKGIGFVTFKDVSSVTLALRLNGEILGKRALRVTLTGQQSKISGEKRSQRQKGKGGSKEAKGEDKGPPRHIKKDIRKKKRAAAAKVKRGSLMT